MSSKVKNKKPIGLERIYVEMLCALLVLTYTACKKLAETPIPTDYVAENAVYSNDATATAVLTSLYTAMNSTPIQSIGDLGTIAVNTGLAGDEFKITAPFISATSIYQYYYQNNLSQATPPFVTGGEHWAPLYNFIFKANAAIAGLSSSQGNSLTPAVRQQLLGEAKFVRAFYYFYLVNEFGDVPLALTTDPQANILLPRSPKAAVYQQIIADLLDAEDKLSSDYLDINLAKTTERVRPTKWAADAMLARVYLYTSDYSQAEQKATVVLNSTSFLLLPTLNSVFLKNSKEAIWQIQPTEQNFNTREGQTLTIPTTGPLTGAYGNPVSISKQLLSSFEINDKRKIKGNWVDTAIYKLTTNGLNDTLPYVSKYKIAASAGVTTVGGYTEYFMVLRLAEQYLIRAEARVQLGNINGAQTDLNAIRNRAGLANTTAADKPSLLTAILHERQVELFAEWGHRWFDLRRTGNIDAVMSVVTPLKTNSSPWISSQQLFPIPLDVLRASPNVTQNLGYQ